MKIAGLCILFCCCVGFGACRVAEKRRRVSALAFWSTVTEQVERGIRHTAKTLPDIFLTASESAKSKAQREVYLSLAEQVSLDALKDSELVTLLSDDTKALLRSFFYKVGRFDETDALRCCQGAKEALTKEFAQKKEAYLTERKTVLGLSVCIGCMLVLLVW